MKLLILLFILSFSFTAHYQMLSEEIHHKFILNLYQDGLLSFQDKENNVVNDICLLEQVKIKYEHLKLKSANFTFFDFYAFTFSNENLIFNNQKDKTIRPIYNPECGKVIIAFNSHHLYNRIYKVKGFLSNDLLFLLNDMKAMGNFKSIKKSLKYLDREFEDIDFRCIYRALKQTNFDSDCLKEGCFIRKSYEVIAIVY